ncbi:unnamed protein product [Toxocara canis]|uniref:SusD/RagB family nutrient-binding outer membrane lipoprotein n=1 Tax=Toxocara canis TaxID=6265 RepID=A0A183U063_TOXCA|nr:unnamed protein product [Toxocara canis]
MFQKTAACWLHDSTGNSGVIAEDGSTLDDVSRARFVVPKLDAAAYARFNYYFLSKRASEVCFDYTAKTLTAIDTYHASIPPSLPLSQNPAQQRISQGLYGDGQSTT